MRTKVAIIDLSNPSNEPSISELQKPLPDGMDPDSLRGSIARGSIPWNLLFPDMIQIGGLYDDVQLALLPNDPFKGNFPLYVFYNKLSVNVISEGSYYFPFGSILDAMVTDPKGGTNSASNNNTAWEIYHQYEFVEMEGSSFSVIVPTGYELHEKPMWGDIKRRVVLDPIDVASTLNDTSAMTPFSDLSSSTTPNWLSSNYWSTRVF